MAILIIVLFVFAGFHFIMESIWIPSERVQVRFKLFALRDRLRNLYISNQDHDRKAVDILEKSLNTNIAYLAAYNFGFRLKLKGILEDHPNIKKTVDRDLKVLDEARSIEIKEIIMRRNAYMNDALAINSYGWIGILSPLIFVNIIYVLIRMFIKFIGFEKIAFNYRFTKIKKKLFNPNAIARLGLVPPRFLEGMVFKSNYSR